MGRSDAFLFQLGSLVGGRWSVLFSLFPGRCGVPECVVPRGTMRLIPRGFEPCYLSVLRSAAPMVCVMGLPKTSDSYP